jgi:hypothetical protein
MVSVSFLSSSLVILGRHRYRTQFVGQGAGEV